MVLRLSLLLPSGGEGEGAAPVQVLVDAQEGGVRAFLMKNVDLVDVS